MADLSQHANYTGKYSGLLDNLWLTLAIGGACLVGYEIEIRVSRRRGWQGSKQWSGLRIWRASKRAWERARRGNRDIGHVESKLHTAEKKGQEGQDGKYEDAERRRLGDREAWEFGYIYQPKAWALNRSRPVPRWPLQWIWTSLRIKEADMPPIWGCDLTLHARFLRGSLFYIFIQVLVVMPVLMPLHILYSPDTIAKTSMLRASVSSLVETTGDKWLWVHCILIWWSSILWLATALWIVWGGIGYRKREVERLRERQKIQVKQVDEDPEGAKQFRTLMVLNIPPDMRDEDILREYFEHNLQRHRARTNRPMITMTGAMKEVNKAFIRPALMMARNNNSREMFSRVGSAIGLSDRRDSADLRSGNSGSGTPVTPAVRSAPVGDTGKELSKERSNDRPRSAELCRDEDADDEEGDVDEVILVRKLGSLISLRERRAKVLQELELAHVAFARRVLAAVSKHKKEYLEASGSDVPGISDSTSFSGISRKQRLDILTKELGQFVDDEPEQMGHSQETVWEVLHRLPKVLTDPYQALMHLPITTPFRKSNAPVIDYLTTKLAYLTMLLDKARSQPLEDYASSSAAFVVFKDAHTARFALKVLDNHPTRSLACHAHAAPNWVEVLWPRLGTSVYRSGFVRGWVVFLGVWAFTLAWVFPVSLFCALTSLSNIAEFLPPLANWLAKNPKASSAITSLAPVILVALLTISICPILLVLANRTEHIVTRLGIHNSVLERFWKFLMVNGVVFFAIGQASIEAYLTAFKSADFNPLPIVAQSFPTAAPYFASYILLQTAIQPCFEIFRFGLPAIVYWFGTRWSKIPRQRWSRTEHPTFSHFSQLPYQLLAVAISNLFMLLNPLVLPFALIYYTCCYVVWKRQFMFVYGRLYENNGRRSCVRIFRYSLDALALAQFALFAFFILSKAKGSAVSTGCLFFITLGIKLILTRAIKQRFDNLEIEEADIICPPGPCKMMAPQATRLSETFDDELDDPQTTFRLKSRFEVWRQRVARELRHYAYAGVVLPAGYIKPIPFDHLLLSWLDRYFTYPMTPYPEQPSASLPAEPADTAITAELVVPHTKLAPWEDIPPFQRSRAYWDQPAYTDPYDDYLWLPRDPLSTLDLDDTVEMRASLTTSLGGTGRFACVGDVDDDEEEAAAADETMDEEEREVIVHEPTPRPSEDDNRPSISPMSNHRLLGGILDDREPLPSPPLFTSTSQVGGDIGSEVDRGPAGTLRKNTIRFADSLQDVFRRPRSQSRLSDDSEVVTMRTLSRASASSLRAVAATGAQTQTGQPVVESPVEELKASPNDGSLTAQPSQNRMPSGSSFQGTGSPILQPIDLPPPQLHGPRSPTGTSSRISFNPADLGRSPSRRRPTPPHPVRNPTQTSVSSGSIGQRPSGAMSPRLGLSPTPTGFRTASIRSGSGGGGGGGGVSGVIASAERQRDRSGSNLSAEQAALWREIMEEERIASQSAQEAERANQEAEKEELRKERERVGHAGPFIESGSGMGRAASMSISGEASAGDMKRSVTIAPGASTENSRIRRRGTLAGVGRVIIAANRVSSINRSRPETAAVHISRDRSRSVSSTVRPEGPVTAPLPAASASVPLVRPEGVGADGLPMGQLSSAGLQRGKTVIERMREQQQGAPQSLPQPERAGAGPTGMAATSGWGI